MLNFGDNLNLWSAQKQSFVQYWIVSSYIPNVFYDVAQNPGGGGRDLPKIFTPSSISMDTGQYLYKQL